MRYIPLALVLLAGCAAHANTAFSVAPKVQLPSASVDVGANVAGVGAGITTSVDSSGVKVGVNAGN